MPVPERTRAIHRPLLRDTAYDALCDAIVTGTLAPGELLHDNELCAWLGLSRTPVRDALARLEDEGLVETSPQRYTRVAPIDGDDVHGLFPVLAAAHALATELAVPHLRRTDIARLHDENAAYLAALGGRDAERAHAADGRFHGVFVERSDNAVLSQMLERLEPRLHRLELLCTGPLHGRRSAAQHEAIVARAAAGDAARAATAARENWLTLGSLVERATTSAVVAR